MDIQFFIDNLQQPAIILPAIRNCYNTYFAYEWYKQYDPYYHTINDRFLRKDRPTKRETGSEDENGNPIMETIFVRVNRIALALQKIIVMRAVAFLAGGQINLKANAVTPAEIELGKLINDCWKANKLDFKNIDIAERLKSETECVEIWYSTANKNKKVELKLRVYSPSQGFRLYPVFDAMGDMIAFGIEWDDLRAKTRHFDIYTDTEITRYIDTGKGWTLTETIKILYGKMPCIFYKQHRPEWSIVQSLIDRLELVASNHGDTNDYHASPTLVASGTVLSAAQKGETGKIYELETGGDIKYVTWDNAPQSIKMEIENLEKWIYTLTQTPNISFQEMKGLGNLSGTALERIMIDAHLKAVLQQKGNFGEMIQRRLNFMKAALIEMNPQISGIEAASDMNIEAQFTLFNIDDLSDKIAVALAGNGGKPVLTHKQSIELVGQTDDVDATMETIMSETSINDKTSTTIRAIA